MLSRPFDLPGTTRVLKNSQLGFGLLRFSTLLRGAFTTNWPLLLKRGHFVIPNHDSARSPSILPDHLSLSVRCSLKHR